MEIQWHGLSSFSLKGKSATVLTDPYDREKTGLKLPKLAPHIVLSNADFDIHHAISQFGMDVKVFDWPGEYEAKNINIQGIPAYDRPREKDLPAEAPKERRLEDSKKDSANRVIIFMIELDGFKICHLSNLGHKLTPEMLEAIGDVDILLIPVGGGVCLDAKKAHEVIEQLDPRVVIPMYYKIPGIKLALADVETFLKEVGLHMPSSEKTLKFLSPSQVPQEQTEFKILEPVLG